MSNEKPNSSDVSVICIKLDSSLISSLEDLSFIAKKSFPDFCRMLFIRGLISFISSRL